MSKKTGGFFRLCEVVRLLVELTEPKKEDEEVAAVALGVPNLSLDNKRILDKIGDIEQQEHHLPVKMYECILASAEPFPDGTW
jgi:hypothetical protein